MTAPNYSALDRARTKEILELADSILRREVHVARRRLGARGVVLLEVEDMRSYGRLAALEAALDFDESRGASLRTWVHSRIRWRLHDEVRRVRKLLQDEPCDIEGLTLKDPTRRNDGSAQSPEELYAECEEAQEKRAWVAQAAATLPRRAQILVHYRLTGAEGTDSELAATFGVARSQVSRGLASAITKLALLARTRGTRGVAA